MTFRRLRLCRSNLTPVSNHVTHVGPIRASSPWIRVGIRVIGEPLRRRVRRKILRTIHEDVEYRVAKAKNGAAKVAHDARVLVRSPYAVRVVSLRIKAAQVRSGVCLVPAVTTPRDLMDHAPLRRGQSGPAWLVLRTTTSAPQGVSRLHDGQAKVHVAEVGNVPSFADEVRSAHATTSVSTKRAVATSAAQQTQRPHRVHLGARISNLYRATPAKHGVACAPSPPVLHGSWMALHPSVMTVAQALVMALARRSVVLVEARKFLRDSSFLFSCGLPA